MASFLAKSESHDNDVTPSSAFTPSFPSDILCDSPSSDFGDKVASSSALVLSEPAQPHIVPLPKVVAPQPVHSFSEIHSTSGTPSLFPSELETEELTLSLGSLFNPSPSPPPQTVTQSSAKSHLQNTLPPPLIVVHPPSPTPSRSPSPPPFLSQFIGLSPPLFIPDFLFDLYPYSLTYQPVGSHPNLVPNLLSGSPATIRVRSPTQPPHLHLPTPVNRHSNPPHRRLSITPPASPNTVR
ncbi:hypothetical protein Clacol_003420 [Clathrus columnatus]|uniref:Uncharacterized protein n=1 Tax=Clathrus columnatus TaxID=1419009 RepID=A0AAV5A6U8_9AGAM|nr:hypothetical protein Clacol_003420 [Clathrus columnatus]